MAHQTDALRALGVEVDVLTRARLAHHFPVQPRPGDVVHLHSLALAELALELTRRYALPLVYTSHALVHLEVGETRWTRVQRAVLEAADQVLFVSHSERDAALELLPSLAGRSRVLHNGVPEPPPPRPYDAAGPVVFAGRFTRSKGIDVVDALCGAIGADVVVAGGHGEVMPRAHSLGWLDRDALDALFASAAVVLMPSRYEPFGMVALEAMRMGAPLLAADVGGLREIVTPESGGRTVRGHDPATWIAACQALLSDVAAREAMHARGPAYVARHFSARAQAEAFRDILCAW